MAKLDIPLDRAYLVALWLETYIYGVYTVIFVTALYLLFFKRSGFLSWTIVIPTVIMYCLASTHVAIVLARNILGFAVRGRHELGGAEQFFLEADAPLNVANQFVYATNNIIGDSILIWRCWVVWSRNWKIIIAPCLLLCATAVTGYNAAFQFSRSHSGVFNPGLAFWGRIFFGCTLGTNVLVTGLIAGRIWWMGRAISSASRGSGSRLSGGQRSLGSMSGRYWGILLVIVESGALYSTCLVIEIVLYMTHTNAIYVLFDAMAQVIGLVPTLIVVVVGLGLTTENSTAVETHTNESIKFNVRPRPAYRSDYSSGIDSTDLDSATSPKSPGSDDRYASNNPYGKAWKREPYTIPHSARNPNHIATFPPEIDIDSLPSARAIQLDVAMDTYFDDQYKTTRPAYPYEGATGRKSVATDDTTDVEDKTSPVTTRTTTIQFQDQERGQLRGAGSSSGHL